MHRDTPLDKSEARRLCRRSLQGLLLLLSFDLALADVRAQREFSLPLPESTARTVDLWATHYFVYSAAENNQGYPLLDRGGSPLTGKLSPKDWCQSAIEGTVQVVNGDRRKTFNYAGELGLSQVDCALTLKINPSQNRWISSVGRSYFAAAKGPYGDGVAGFILVPLRTIAVDREKIPLGTVIFVPAARGLMAVLPDGTSIQHDGYFFAGDTGGAVKGTHVDVFCGVMSSNCFPSFIGSAIDKPFKALIVSDPYIQAQLMALHRP